MTRAELIEIGTKIVKAECSEKEHEELMDLFDQNVPKPDGSNLFYYPESYNARRDDLSMYSPTVEEVVDQCLAYKAIQL